jgi:hypothetical protein
VHCTTISYRKWNNYYLVQQESFRSWQDTLRTPRSGAQVLASLLSISMETHLRIPDSSLVDTVHLPCPVLGSQAPWNSPFRPRVEYATPWVPGETARGGGPVHQHLSRPSSGPQVLAVIPCRLHPLQPVPSWPPLVSTELLPHLLPHLLITHP